jgi:hypothetical protein
MGEPTDCVICWDCIDINNSYQKWNCSHLFHKNCAETWNNGCPICRTQELFNDGHCEPVTWLISKNPQNVLDLERMKNSDFFLQENLEPIYKNKWKDRQCIDLDHKLLYFDTGGVVVICENCNTIQSYNRLH